MKKSALKQTGVYAQPGQPALPTLPAMPGVVAALTDKEADIQAWQQYKQSRKKSDRNALLKRMDPLIHTQVNKWAGPVPAQVLRNQAKVLAAKALDTYDPNKGTALSTHVVNNLAPLSRTVYTHQNSSRLPENVTLQMRSYLEAKDNLEATMGREPSVDELHQTLGWSVPELQRLEAYRTTDLVESVGGVRGDFYDSHASADDDMLAAIFMDLAPQEKKLLEYVTGYGGGQPLTNTEIMKKLNVTQAQLSYRKTLLRDKIASLQRNKRSSR